MEINKRIYLVILTLVAFWCGGILLAPALRTVSPVLSSFFYSFYAPICHEIDARSFHIHGEKLGVCIRCSAIYFSFFASLLSYPFLRPLSSPGTPRRRWIALAMLPMIVDVLLDVAGIHVSTAVTRVISGALFGLILPFFLLPPLIEGVRQLRYQISARGGFFYARKA